MSQNPVWFGVASVYSVVVSVLLCRYSRPLGERFGLLDHPKGIKRHREPTPLMGGLALMAVLIPLSPLFVGLFEPEGLGNRALTVTVAATLLMALIGAIDDRIQLRATVRFGAALVVFAAAMAIEHRFIIDRLLVTGLGSSVALWWPAGLAFSALIHVGFVNSVNMTDGKNGLVISLCIVWMLALLAVGPPGLIIVLLPLLQMLAVLLVYNLQGRIFLGDGGTYGLAAFLSLVSVYIYRTSETALRADHVAVFYLIPGLDMLRLFFSRLARGMSPFAGDRQHFHHLLERRFGWKIGLVIYVMLVAVPIIVVMAVPERALLIFAAGTAFYCIGLLMIWQADARRDVDITVKGSPPENEASATE